jgi:hypothetical protein
MHTKKNQWYHFFSYFWQWVIVIRYNGYSFEVTDPPVMTQEITES